MNCMALREPYVPPLEPGCAYTPKLELVVVPYCASSQIISPLVAEKLR